MRAIGGLFESWNCPRVKVGGSTEARDKAVDRINLCRLTYLPWRGRILNTFCHSVRKDERSSVHDELDDANVVLNGVGRHVS